MKITITAQFDAIRREGKNRVKDDIRAALAELVEAEFSSYLFEVGESEYEVTSCAVVGTPAGTARLLHAPRQP